MLHLYKGRLISEVMITKMTTRQLVEYEKYLWTWMGNSPPNVVTVLNSIYREIEWRAQDTDFQ
jgi:hypothetical protein